MARNFKEHKSMQYIAKKKKKNEAKKRKIKKEDKTKTHQKHYSALYWLPAHTIGFVFTETKYQ